MMAHIYGFIQWLFGCEYDTAVEIYYALVGVGLGSILIDITESLKRIADNGGKK